jgi:hypothetical protein
MTALNSTRLAMAATAKGSDVKDPQEITCPHGIVTFKLSRIE